MFVSISFGMPWSSSKNGKFTLLVLSGVESITHRASLRDKIVQHLGKCPIMWYQP
jgi:hypothetical protein